jgi:hypothetical protein
MLGSTLPCERLLTDQAEAEVLIENAEDLANLFGACEHYRLNLIKHARLIRFVSICLLPNAGTLKQHRGMRIAARLFHQTANARPRDSVLLRDLRQTQPGATVVNYLLSVYIEPRSPDLASF